MVQGGVKHEQVRKYAENAAFRVGKEPGRSCRSGKRNFKMPKGGGEHEKVIGKKTGLRLRRRYSPMKRPPRKKEGTEELGQHSFRYRGGKEESKVLGSGTEKENKEMR